MAGLILFSVVVVSAIIWLVLLFMPMRWRISQRWDDTAGDLPVPANRFFNLNRGRVFHCPLQA